jgi:protein-tyrosine phosphatase
MIKILFVCHGNICRSPMAELIMEDYVAKRGQRELFVINSRALTTEEIGNDIYPPAKSKLIEKGIPLVPHEAKLMTKIDYDSYDYIIGMDQENMIDISKMFGNSDKAYKLLYFLGNSYDISDPWYTHDFERAYNDIYQGIVAFYSFLEKNNKIY